MKIINSLFRLIVRFRYPVTLPEDVAVALGVDISNFITFDEFIQRLTSPKCIPTRIERYMPRESAEKAFQRAQREERFHRTTLYSYFFNEGWLEFKLEFDADSRLRRLYLQHRTIAEEGRVEIHI